jgi:hypothetical protein
MGVMPIWVEAAVIGEAATTVQPENAEFNVLAFVRASKRIMEGKLFLPDDIWDGVSGKSLAGINGYNIQWFLGENHGAIISDSKL